MCSSKLQIHGDRGGGTQESDITTLRSGVLQDSLFYKNHNSISAKLLFISADVKKKTYEIRFLPCQYCNKTSVIYQRTNLLL